MQININLEHYLEPMPVMAILTEGEGTIVGANRLWLDELELGTKDIEQKNITNFLSKTSKKYVHELFGEFNETKEAINIPFEFITKSAQFVYTLASSKTIDLNSKHYQLTCLTNISSIVNFEYQSTKKPTNWIIEPKYFYTRLSQLRKNAKYTQDKMATVLGMSSRTYQRLEQGLSSITIEHILILAKHFNFSPHLFFVQTHPSNDEAKTVLLVDDEKGILEILSERLKHWGYKVKTALDGEEALKCLEGEKFDIMITDLRMPKLNGEELIKKVQTVDKYKDLKVLIYSSFVLKDMWKSLNLPPEHVLEKPINFDLLKMNLEKLA